MQSYESFLIFRDHLHIFVGQLSPLFSSTVCFLSCQLSFNNCSYLFSYLLSQVLYRPSTFWHLAYFGNLLYDRVSDMVFSGLYSWYHPHFRYLQSVLVFLSDHPTLCPICHCWLDHCFINLVFQLAGYLLWIFLSFNSVTYRHCVLLKQISFTGCTHFTKHLHAP